MLGLLELLCPRGLDPNAKVKLVRHQDKRYDLEALERDGSIEVYQSYQSKTVFECDYVVSFIGLEKSRARLHGVYRVQGRTRAEEHPAPPELRHLMPTDGYWYDLRPVAGFDDLKGRMVINWGAAALSWHQWLSNKEVVEILPSGYVREFPGYLDFVLTFDELAGIMRNPEANREWHRMLAAVAGVYLIVDRRTGKQYVGSASGEGGILSRWTAYASTGHGGNKQLMQLLEIAPGYAREAFTFTILHTLPRSMTRTEVIDYESRYKKKLGSRAFGLNSN